MTYVPPDIGDLGNLVVIPGGNEPSGEAAPRRTFSKSTNSLVFGASKVGTREGEILLFLGNNRISTLPKELFNLDALVVLSLRELSISTSWSILVLTCFLY